MTSDHLMRSLASTPMPERPYWARTENLALENNFYAPATEPLKGYWTIHQPNIFVSDSIMTVYIEAAIAGIRDGESVTNLLVDYDDLSDSRLRSAHIPCLERTGTTVHVSYPWRRYPPDSTPSSRPAHIREYQESAKRFIDRGLIIAKQVSVGRRHKGIIDRYQEIMSALYLSDNSTIAHLLFSISRFMLEFYGIGSPFRSGVSFWSERQNDLTMLIRSARDIERVAYHLGNELTALKLHSALLKPGSSSRIWTVDTSGRRVAGLLRTGGVVVPGVILDDLGEASILGSARTFIYQGSQEHYLIASELARRTGMQAPHVLVCPRMHVTFHIESSDINPVFASWITLLNNDARYSHMLRFLLCGDRIKERIALSVSPSQLDQ